MLVLAADWMLVLLGLPTAHFLILAHAARISLLRKRWRNLLTLLWLALATSLYSSLLSRYEALLVATGVVTLCTARRIYLALLTLRANHKPSITLPLLAQLIGTLNTSPCKFK